MVRFPAILRFLALAACLVPFTAAQMTAGAVAPLSAPDGEPREEPEDEREESEGQERVAVAHRHALPARQARAAAARAPHRTHSARPRTRAPAPADPLRNGLGTFYRC